MGTVANADDNAVIETLFEVAELKSGSSQVPTTILFKNGCTERIRIFWINYHGDHVPYRLLEPGQTHRQPTYLSHPWTYKSELTGYRMVVDKRPALIPTREEYAANIIPPQPLPWSTENHVSRFPASFVAATQAFLLSHRHLEIQSADAPYLQRTVGFQVEMPLKPAVKDMATSPGLHVIGNTVPSTSTLTSLPSKICARLRGGNAAIVPSASLGLTGNAMLAPLAIPLSAGMDDGYEMVEASPLVSPVARGSAPAGMLKSPPLLPEVDMLPIDEEMVLPPSTLGAITTDLIAIIVRLSAPPVIDVLAVLPNEAAALPAPPPGPPAAEDGVADGGLI